MDAKAPARDVYTVVDMDTHAVLKVNGRRIAVIDYVPDAIALWNALHRSATQAEAGQ